MTKPATNTAKHAAKIQRLLSASFPDVSSVPEAALTEALAQEFPPDQALQIAQSLKQDSTGYSGISPEFVAGYLGETDDRAFEDKTGAVFAALGFEVIMRPRPAASVATEIEILLKYGQNLCGIIDAKNYRPKFTLSAQLASHMGAEYIPNYADYHGAALQFYGYVTARHWGGARNLDKITAIAQRVVPDRPISGMMLSAATLLGFLDYCLDSQIPPDERAALFVRAAQNQAFPTVSALLQATGRAKPSAPLQRR